MPFVLHTVTEHVALADTLSFSRSFSFSFSVAPAPCARVAKVVGENVVVAHGSESWMQPVHVFVCVCVCVSDSHRRTETDR